MAAFPARDRAAFDAHWATNILGNPAAVKQTILLDGQVAGNIGSWPQDGIRLVGYWIGKEHWGKGVATRALAAFLHLVTERPLHARCLGRRWPILVNGGGGLWSIGFPAVIKSLKLKGSA
ncbi:MAG TPA: GNAT family N-acetyltransferase [Coriobacteriia bacterium]|nr:GNAT family N-acetyltransferase [Coriobacteriia bacterium]